jgi:NAD(P)-dependent dehydrogenase (short-subunit alcohol dehydrogenase family)
MSDTLAGEVAIVTGGSSGIGRAIALELADAGASVCVGDIRDEPRLGGTPTHEQICDQGGDATFVETDVSSVDAIRSLVSETVDTSGSLDVMVNNAGARKFLEIDETTEDDYEHFTDINLKGAYFGCKHAVEQMRTQENGGRIVNIASISGIQGYVPESVYGAAKAGVINLTKELAVEQGPNGVRVNAISPGAIRTALSKVDEDVGSNAKYIPLRRDGQPEDVAKVALFLASNQSEYVNGHNVVVDGGVSAGTRVA